MPPTTSPFFFQRELAKVIKKNLSLKAVEAYNYMLVLMR